MYVLICVPNVTLCVCVCVYVCVCMYISVLGFIPFPYFISLKYERHCDPCVNVKLDVQVCAYVCAVSTDLCGCVACGDVVMLV